VIPATATSTHAAEAAKPLCGGAMSIHRQTRLVEANGRTALELRGRRTARGQALRVNGHPITPTGGRAWSARLPLETVRNLAAPFARTMTVEASCTSAGDEWHARQVRLPTGLLGHTSDLAALEVSMR
jgi:hypothetical protein